jgi:uncharacterized membrane protein
MLGLFMNKNLLIFSLLTATFFSVFFLKLDRATAAPGTFRGGAGTAFCGSLTAGYSTGGACDSSIHTGSYRGANIGQNRCVVLTCTF